MVKRLVLLAAFALSADAATLRFFGSAGAESQLTPANLSSPLNPQNIAGIPMQTNGVDASAFVEAAPESKRWKARVKVRGAASDRGSDNAQVGEAFVQVRATPWLDLAAGRVIEKWGTGYGWTPTAFVGPSRNPTDPNDRRSANRGADMLRADLFVKETTVSLYALGGGAFAARAYRLVRGTDVSLAFRSDRNDPSSAFGTFSPRGGEKEEHSLLPANGEKVPKADEGRRILAGLSLSRVFGDALELHAEVAHDDGDVRAVAGGQYTFRNDTNLVVELYHGTDGLTRGEWDDFRAAAPRDLREANARFAPLRMARTYAFVRAFRSFEKLDAEAIAIANVRDGSGILRLSLTRKLRPNVSVYLIDTEFVGGDGSELSYVQVARIVSGGVRVHF